jgi:hypothetical protein
MPAMSIDQKRITGKPTSSNLFEIRKIRNFRRVDDEFLGGEQALCIFAYERTNEIRYLAQDADVGSFGKNDHFLAEGKTQ